jgi:DNA polymerase I-like protein with 3'-5' exonuclease and polymerase domains
MLDVITIDFETFAIEKRPKYPPKPVGVAIYEPKKDPYYLAWGHPEENNCSKEWARQKLSDLWCGPRPLLFHNAKFDLEVGHQHLHLPLVPPSGFAHDTMILAYLADPRLDKLSLKDLAQRFLSLEPEEQSELKDWILANVTVNTRKVKPSQWGAMIAFAPAELVGRYAIGDVVRTHGLFKHFHKLVEHPAYLRERELFSGLIEMERYGVPIASEQLKEDTDRLEAAFEDVSAYLKGKIGDIELDSPVQLADALERAGYIDEWILTPKGHRSTSRTNLDLALNDDVIRNTLRYRRAAATCIRTFMRPWYEQSLALGGRIATTWNQVRQPNERKAGLLGTRTGRLSSSPNFQNMPNPFVLEALPTELALPDLPKMRSYIAPPEGCTLGQADYSQQELRILAHYVGGLLKDSYLYDAHVDIHSMARELINRRVNGRFTRKAIKNVGFGLIYGMGISALSAVTSTTAERAKQLKGEYLRLFPGIQALYDEMYYRAKHYLPFVTWGGRTYFCEPSKVVDGQFRQFGYKMVNALIQGSAADCTKEAMRLYFRDKPDDVHVILTVHDEIVVIIDSRKTLYVREVMHHLSETMSGVNFNVPMVVDCKTSTRNFAELEPLNLENAA